jgi:hypothetical protein
VSGARAGISDCRLAATRSEAKGSAAAAIRRRSSGISDRPDAKSSARAIARGAVFILAGLALVGCSPPQVRTTFLRSVDLIEMTDTMAQSLARDDLITARQPDDEPWVISMYRVVNHTNQIIPDREKWLYLARLRALLARTDISEQRSLIWVIPPERWPIVAEELGVSEEPYGLRMSPTHQLTAEFNALTITSAAGRSDTYVCAYQLIDLHRGTIVWEAAWDVKRAVQGVTYD